MLSSTVEGAENGGMVAVATKENGSSSRTRRRDGSLRGRLGRALFFGVEPSADTVAIALVYFVQGVTGLSNLALSFYLKDDLALSPAEIAFVTSAGTFPWLIKPLYGFASDSFPLFGYRRRSYMAVCGLAGCAGWAALATVASTKATVIGGLLLSSVGVAMADVVVDSVVVERVREEQDPSLEGSLQSLSWGARAVGSIAAGFWGGALVEEYGPRFVFSVTAFLPLLVTLVSLVLEEERISDKEASAGVAQALEQAKRQASLMWSAVRRREIWSPTAFLFLWQATPSAPQAMFFFQTERLGFTPEFLGRVQLATAFASLAGVVLFNTQLQAKPLRTVFLWSALVGTALSLTQLLLVTGMSESMGIPNEAFAVADSVALAVVGQVAFMPVLVLAARVCPEGVEATLFALLMSICNSGAVSSGFLGGQLTDTLGVTKDNFDNLPLLLTICGLCSLAPLPLLAMVPQERAPPQDEKQA